MANTNFQQLPQAIGLTGTEIVPILQAGVDKRTTTGTIAALGFAQALPGAIEVTVDGAGSNIAAQTWVYLTVPFNAVVTSATMLADNIGSIIMDVWKCTYAQYNAPSVPSSANSITGSATPTITSSNKYQSTNLSAWTTTTLNQGEVLAFNVPSTSTGISKVTLSLGLTRVVS